MTTKKIHRSGIVVISTSIFIAMLIAGCSGHREADKLVIGKIWTGNTEQPWAGAMAIVGDSIVAIGSVEELASWKGDKTIEERADTTQLIVPGFIDCHTHFIAGGQRLSSVKLRDAKTPQEFIQRIAAFVKTVQPGTWITGGDWDHQLWGGTLPSREWIDSVSPANPVWVHRLDGHMGLANTAALKAAGVKDDVKDIPGGTIVRVSGKLTGLLKDNAEVLVNKAVPPVPDEMLDRALDAAMNYVASNGVTSVHSLTGTSDDNYYQLYKRALQNNKLITRIYAASALKDWHEIAKKVKDSGDGDKWLRIGLIKVVLDGSLGSHTAAFMQPFTDNPKDSGFFLMSVDSLYPQVKAADSAGLHFTIHAIGDKTIHVLLDLFERIARENGAKDRRFRMEHAQHIAPADIARFAELNIIPSMQPYHAIDDGRWAEKVIGHKRATTTYAFRSLLDARAKLAFGSDWFVAPATPLEGIYAAATRRTIDDKNPDGWIPEQKITVEEAMRAYTINAAYASFEEKIKGSLEKGKLADYVVLSDDITVIDPVKIRDVKIVKTVVGGREVFKSK
jgi:predicted amidohydrolase YtcJ